MKNTRFLYHIFNKFMVIILPHPLNLGIHAEIQNSFNDIASMTLRIYSLWVCVPKKRLTKIDFFRRFFHHINYNIFNARRARALFDPLYVYDNARAGPPTVPH